MDTQQYITNFYQRSVIPDFSRDFLLRVLSINFDGPGGEQLSEQDLIYARTAKLPGRNIVNHEVKYAGQTFNVPGSVTYPGSDNYELEFYCSETSQIRERLMNESHRTFGNQLGIAGSGATGGSITGPNSRIVLVQLDKRLEAVCQYDLVGCSIRNVGEMSYNIADGNGAVQVFNVGIAYHFFNRKLTNSVTANNS
jgi:hypothetical protein